MARFSSGYTPATATEGAKVQARAQVQQVVSSGRGGHTCDFGGLRVVSQRAGDALKAKLVRCGAVREETSGALALLPGTWALAPPSVRQKVSKSGCSGTLPPPRPPQHMHLPPLMCRCSCIAPGQVIAWGHAGMHGGGQVRRAPPAARGQRRPRGKRCRFRCRMRRRWCWRSTSGTR